MTPDQKHIADRDWPEDFAHENGNYLCLCCLCKETFAGHKRRIVCKLCDQPNAKAAPEPVQGEAVEPFAWAEFDGEGVYDLRLYENNEDFHQEYVERNGEKYSGWIMPLYTAPPAHDAELVALLAECRKRLIDNGADGVLRGQIDAKLAELRKSEQAATQLPRTCRQRLMAEGKQYPRSGCWACGDMSPKWRECDQAIATMSKEAQ